MSIESIKQAIRERFDVAGGLAAYTAALLELAGMVGGDRGVVIEIEGALSRIENRTVKLEVSADRLAAMEEQARLHKENDFREHGEITDRLAALEAQGNGLGRQLYNHELRLKKIENLLDDASVTPDEPDDKAVREGREDGKRYHIDPEKEAAIRADTRRKAAALRERQATMKTYQAQYDRAHPEAPTDYTHGSQDGNKYVVFKLVNGRPIATDNTYLVVNTDEPYAEQVFELIRDNETAKGTWDGPEDFDAFNIRIRERATSHTPPEQETPEDEQPSTCPVCGWQIGVRAVHFGKPIMGEHQEWCTPAMREDHRIAEEARRAWLQQRAEKISCWTHEEVVKLLHRIVVRYSDQIIIYGEREEKS